MSENPVIHWFRRDLRLDDNLALAAALATGRPVIPLFIFDPAILGGARTGAPRLGFLLRALESLDGSLRRHGARLMVRQGDPLTVLRALIEATGADALYFNRDYSPYALRRDYAAESLGVAVHADDDVLLLPPGSVLKGDGDPYVVFTPFLRQWKTLAKPECVDFTGGRFHTPDSLMSDSIPTLDELGFGASIDLPPACEGAAHSRLRYFSDGPLYEYAAGRDALVAEPFADDTLGGTSALSPYLRLGLISPRRAYWAARAAYAGADSAAARQSVEVWVSELAWREFYMHILYHFPHVEQGSFQRQYDAVSWRDAPDELAAWQEGHTGYPVIDAAMRQLNAIGWMPNRARMIVASFLTKDLLIDWRAGERYFMQRLIDGDPAANNGGWQWSAGTGTDAQPYFRIFNPVSQSQKFDPDGAYIRHWVPELRAVPNRYIHAPWQMDRPPRDYPAPIVDHGMARERTLAAYKAARSQS